jgi:hypothetical protein
LPELLTPFTRYDWIPNRLVKIFTTRDVSPYLMVLKTIPLVW